MPRYDHDVRSAEQRAVTAEIDFAAVRGTATAFGTWMRLAHWRRLLGAQQLGLHWFYLHTVTDQVCICGLQQPLAASTNPGDHFGHLDPQTWQPTALLLVPHPTATQPPGTGDPDVDQEVRSARRAVPVFTVLCQTCGWSVSATPRSSALAARASHPRHERL